MVVTSNGVADDADSHMLESLFAVLVVPTLSHDKFKLELISRLS